MNTHRYKIVEPSGRVTYVRAETLKDATRNFLTETGMPEDFFNEHCLIKIDFDTKK